MRGSLNATADADLDKAKTAADAVAASAQPGVEASAMTGYGDDLQQQIQAQHEAESLKTEGGLQDLIKQQHPGERDVFAGFDAGLAGPNSSAYTDTIAKAQTLSDYLDKTTQAAQRQLGNPMNKGNQRGPQKTPAPPIPDTGPYTAPDPSREGEPEPSDLPPGYYQPRDDQGNPTGPPQPIP